jgi:hypothetical protein
MAEKNATPESQASKGMAEQGGLGVRSPNLTSRSVAVPKAGAVEDDHSVCLRSPLNEPARGEILNHAAVSMQQDERLSCPVFDIVQPNAVHLDETAHRGISALRALRKLTIHNRG